MTRRTLFKALGLFTLATIVTPKIESFLEIVGPSPDPRLSNLNQQIELLKTFYSEPIKEILFTENPFLKMIKP